MLAVECSAFLGNQKGHGICHFFGGCIRIRSQRIDGNSVLFGLSGAGAGIAQCGSAGDNGSCVACNAHGIVGGEVDDFAGLRD